MHQWPEIQAATSVALVFGLDPLTVLNSTAEDLEIRLACTQAAEQMTGGDTHGQ